MKKQSLREPIEKVLELADQLYFLRDSICYHNLRAGEGHEGTGEDLNTEALERMAEQLSSVGAHLQIINED